MFPHARPGGIPREARVPRSPPARGAPLLAMGKKADMSRSLLPDRTWRSIARSLSLSPREFQIVLHVFDDAKEGDIADRMNISAHTVHTHLERLYRKLGVGSRGGMIVRVFAEYVSLASAGGDGKPIHRHRSRPGMGHRAVACSADR